jgi:hypothetical protein
MAAGQTRRRAASPPGTAGRDDAAREPTRALFVAAIANLKAASPLALNGDLAVSRAQFDLTNVCVANY